MERGEFVTVLKRLLDLVARRTTTLAPAPYVNAAAAYTSPERWTREQARLFRACPLVVGYSAEVAPGGGYVARDLAGVPVLVTRAADGVLRAFLNVCRHRASRVADGCGSASRFVCPFHGWTYDPTGRLVGMPGRAGFEGLDPAALGLTALPIAERHGLVFVRLDPQAAPIDIDAYLGDLGPRLAAWGLEGYVALGVKTMDTPVNWKVALDTYTEGYHFPEVHRDTVAQFQLGDLAYFEAHGPHHRLVFAAPSITDLRDQPEDAWVPLDHASVIHGIFPNAVLSVTRANAELFCVTPGGEVGHAITLHHYAAPPFPEALREVHETAFSFSHQLVEGEDYAQARRVQTGLASGLHESVVYGRNEPALQHLHRQLVAALGEGGGGDGCGRPVSAGGSLGRA